MSVWEELTKKRTGNDRFLVVGGAMAGVGLAFGLWAVVVNGDSMPPLAASFVFVGLALIGFAAFTGRRDRRRTDKQ